MVEQVTGLTLTDAERDGLAALRRRIPPAFIEKKGAVSYVGWDKKWAILTHFFPQATSEILDVEVSPLTKLPTTRRDGKDVPREDLDGTKIRVKVRVSIPLECGFILFHEAYGHEWGKCAQDNEDGIKGAVSDAISICCARFGVGLHLYGDAEWDMLQAYLENGEMPTQKPAYGRREVPAEHHPAPVSAPAPDTVSDKSYCGEKLGEYLKEFNEAGITRAELWDWVVGVHGDGDRNNVNWMEVRRTVNQWADRKNLQHTFRQIKLRRPPSAASAETSDTPEGKDTGAAADEPKDAQSEGPALLTMEEIEEMETLLLSPKDFQPTLDLLEARASGDFRILVTTRLRDMTKLSLKSFLEEGHEWALDTDTNKRAFAKALMCLLANQDAWAKTAAQEAVRTVGAALIAGLAEREKYMAKADVLF